MPFRFSLEPVLRLRRSQQRQKEIILQKCTEEVRRVTRERQALEEELYAMQSAQRNKSAITGAELDFDQQRCAILFARRAAAGLRLEHALAQQSLATREFQKSWQEREALEALSRKEQENSALEESRREQRDSDELFLQRFRKRQLLPSAPGKCCRPR